MAVNKSKTAVFFRIAAALLLIALIALFSGETAFYIIREITYNTYLPRIETLFRNFNVKFFLRLIYDFSPVTLGLTSACLSLITIIMLFAAKKKKAGVLILISAAISFGGNILTRILYIVIALPNKSRIISDYLLSNLSVILLEIGEFILLLLLGLLLIGAFKKASKVFGFIILGLFAVSLIYELITLARGITPMIYTLRSKDAFNITAAVLNKLLLPLCYGTKFIAYILCCLGAALKPRDKAVTAPAENTVA